MDLKVEIEQIISGQEYKGTLQGTDIGTVEYNLCFGVPIDKLDEQQPPKDESQYLSWAQGLFTFKVKKSDKDLEISEALFGFMMQTVAGLAIKFHNNAQSQQYNSGDSLVSDAIRNKSSSLLGKLNVGVSIGMSLSYEVDTANIPKILLE